MHMLACGGLVQTNRNVNVNVARDRYASTVTAAAERVVTYARKVHMVDWRMLACRPGIWLRRVRDYDGPHMLTISVVRLRRG